jgi:hypothetical protein
MLLIYIAIDTSVKILHHQYLACLQNSYLNGPLAMLLTYITIDTSVKVLHHQYLTCLLSPQRQASNEKQSSIANKGKGVQKAK